MSTQHTPGPWETDGVPRQERGAIGVFAGEGVACVALIQPGCLPAKGCNDAAQANARLIAAAPDLLAALGTIKGQCTAGLHPANVDKAEIFQIIARTADKAIAKVEGRGT